MQEQGKESSIDSQNKKKENNLKEKKDLICCHDAGLGYENNFHFIFYIPLCQELYVKKGGG